jgi:hypothetical protein
MSNPPEASCFNYHNNSNIRAQIRSRGYGLDDRGFESQQRLGIFLFTIASSLLSNGYQGLFHLGEKRLGSDIDHSPPSSVEVKNEWSYTSILPVRLHGVVIGQSTGTILLYKSTNKEVPPYVIPSIFPDMRVYPKVSGLAAWSENCKWYSFLPLGAVVSLFCESV